MLGDFLGHFINSSAGDISVKARKWDWECFLITRHNLRIQSKNSWMFLLWGTLFCSWHPGTSGEKEEKRGKWMSEKSFPEFVWIYFEYCGILVPIFAELISLRFSLFFHLASGEHLLKRISTQQGVPRHIRRHFDNRTARLLSRNFEQLFQRWRMRQLDFVAK